MRSNIYKLLLFFIFGCLYAIGPFVAKTFAFIPDIDGYIRVAGTNAPVAGVWVEMRDFGDCGPYQYRYAKTDNNGYYLFKGWTQGGARAVGAGVMIDTDLDGTNDAEQHPSIDLCDYDPPNDIEPGSAFSCGRDPFRMTVVKPYNWSGSFDVLGPTKKGGCMYCVNNGIIAPDVPVLYYRPGIAPPPTPTRTPTPTIPASPTPCVGSTTNINPIADVTASSSQPITNFGADDLSVRNEPSDTTISFMKFDLTPYAGQNITSAKIRWYVNASTAASRSAATDFSIRNVNDNFWDESLLTYSTMPTRSNTLASGTGGIPDTWIEQDITAFVDANKGQFISMAIETNDATESAMLINSREALSNKPYIEIISDTCPPPVPTNTPVPILSLSGNVFIDGDLNGVQNGGEKGYDAGGFTVEADGPVTKQSSVNSSGSYNITNLPPGTYTITLLLKSNYGTTTPNPLIMPLTANTTVNFGVDSSAPHVITGALFVDNNKNYRKESNEPYYSGPFTITSTGGNVTTTNSGKFSITRLNRGTYTVSYVSLPPEYRMVYPVNGPPPSYIVRVGNGCNVDATTGASCNDENDVVDLNFAITDAIPWVQGIGMDMRFDGGYNNIIPLAPQCGVGPNGIANGSSGLPGVIYTGDTSPVFGRGQSSSTRWVVGGSAFPELYNRTSNTVPTSYATLLSRLRQTGTTIRNITTLSGCSSLNNCTLPNNLQNQPESVYQANGNLVLNSYTFPNNRNFIILVNGSLTIRGNIDVPVGSSVIFSTSQDIIIPSSVGYVPSCSPGNNTIEGIFSADRHIIVQGNSNCPANVIDRMLRIEGTVIINAALGTGAFQNARDLCGQNASYPTITFAERPDFILNAPDAIKNRNLLYREVAP